jgi:hypothetical protein
LAASRLSSRLAWTVRLRIMTLSSMEYGRLILRRSESPIQQPVTKLGGLPVWVAEPAWPVSPTAGEPMLFIGQIVVEPRLFPVEPGRIAYIFMTSDEAVDGTWDPRSGENAVVIQQTSPGRKATTTEGTRLMETYWANGVALTRPLELIATVSIEPDLPDVPYEELSQWDPERQLEYYAARGQRIGGTPDWIQSDESPAGWRLLLQLPDYPKVGRESIQTNWNFGTGSCYAMISPDCSEGIVLWQCG